MASTVEAPDYDPKTDPARKAKSNDPGWKYAYWQDPAKRDWVTCTLCGHENSGGIKRLKQHLAGGYGRSLLQGEWMLHGRRAFGKGTKELGLKIWEQTRNSSGTRGRPDQLYLMTLGTHLAFHGCLE